jgi:electron transport complex protein RnfB
VPRWLKDLAVSNFPFLTAMTEPMASSHTTVAPQAPNDSLRQTRRDFLLESTRLTGIVLLAGAGGFVAGHHGQAEPLVWQLDPDLCIACGNCAKHCVLTPSAVKAVQFYPLCAMCDICTGYFHVDYKGLNTAGENQLCPTGALVREFIAEQVGVGRFEYHVHKELCIGCGKCVQGCAMMNGSLFLQVQHDRCVNCNECSIALACPTQAFRRVPRTQPYLLKSKARRLLQAGTAGREAG